jgi:hypothetical protein
VRIHTNINVYADVKLPCTWIKVLSQIKFRSAGNAAISLKQGKVRKMRNNFYDLIDLFTAKQRKQEIRDTIALGVLIIIAIILLSILMFLGCAGGNSQPAIITTQTMITPVDPDPENDIITTGLWTSESLKFYDGENIFTWKSEYTARADSHIYAAGNILYYLNDYGQTITTRNLVIAPNYITLNGTDIWTVENIAPADAYAMGAMYKDYTRVYLNANEFGDWHTRQYKADAIYNINGEIIIHAPYYCGTWGYEHLNGSLANIKTVTSDFIIYDYNSTSRTAKINGISVSWSTNFFNAATQWLKSGDKWYSSNGYTWNGLTLVENGSALWDFRSLSNVIISAGTCHENSEDVLYFIQCATGYIIKYIPSTNQYTQSIRLYTGDGQTEIGTYYKQLLKPVIIGDDLYFIFDAQMYKYSFTTGLNAYFTNGVSMVIKF